MATGIHIFRVVGANAKSGADVILMVKAGDSAEAAAKANAWGVFVNDVQPAAYRESASASEGVEATTLRPRHVPSLSLRQRRHILIAIVSAVILIPILIWCANGKEKFFHDRTPSPVVASALVSLRPPRATSPPRFQSDDQSLLSPGGNLKAASPDVQSAIAAGSTVDKYADHNDDHSSHLDELPSDASYGASNREILATIGHVIDYEELGILNGIAAKAGLTDDQLLSRFREIVLMARQRDLDATAALQTLLHSVGFRLILIEQSTKFADDDRLDNLESLDAQLMLDASISRSALRVGLVMRLNDELGVDADGKPLPSGNAFALRSFMSQYVDALKGSNATGDTSFAYAGADGKPAIQSLNMTDADLVQHRVNAPMANGRPLAIGQAGLTAMLMQSSANQEFIQKYGLGSVVRTQQGSVDFQPYSIQQFMGYMTRDLAGQGVTRDAARASLMATNAAGVRNAATIIQRIMSMSEADFDNENKRLTNEAQIMNDVLGKQPGMQNMNMDQYLALAAQWQGQWDQAIQHGPYNRLGNSENAFVMFNDQYVAAAQHSAVFGIRENHDGSR